MADESILLRIKKLLALATSENENEAAIAASKAQQLLLEHNISNEELEGFSAVKHEKVTQIRSEGLTGRNRSGWYGHLADIVSASNLCKILISGAGLVWIGKPSNIEVAQFILKTLSNDLIRFADLSFQMAKIEAAKPGTMRYTPVPHGKTWKNNFYYGACQSIKERLNSNLAQLEMKDNNINALIVRNDIELNEYMGIHYPRLGKVSNHMKYNRSAWEQGTAAGRTIRFQQGLNAGGSNGPRLIGGGS
jgi:hypothetical protein